MRYIHSIRVILLTSLAAAVACGSVNEGGTPPADADGETPIYDAMPTTYDAYVPTHCTPTSGTDLKLQEVATGLFEPLYLTAPSRDARLFIIEQPGLIRIVQDGVLLPAPFLDVEGIVQDAGNEQGLLGMAFHPDYATNGRFFINYTGRAPNGATVIAEYTVSSDANVANTTGITLMTINQPEGNHNGGMITFGNDGYLYIGTGDGGGGGDQHGLIGNGQNLNTLLGKILRIDVDSSPYAIPADNPFSGASGMPEIWAYGLRNPWRFSFDTANGDIYIADVGQNAIEEVNVQAGDAAGLNYGWRIMEASDCFNPANNCDQTGLVLPTHEYPQTQGRRSITGGYVYRGVCLPDIAGRYFFGDYVGEQIYTFEYQGGAAINLEDLTSDIDPGSVIAGLTSFGTDGFGELYVVSRDGKIYKVVAR